MTIIKLISSVRSGELLVYCKSFGPWVYELFLRPPTDGYARGRTVFLALNCVSAASCWYLVPHAHYTRRIESMKLGFMPRFLVKALAESLCDGEINGMVTAFSKTARRC